MLVYMSKLFVGLFIFAILTVVGLFILVQFFAFG